MSAENSVSRSVSKSVGRDLTGSGGGSGSNPDHVRALADANAAILNLTSASTYATDIVWQWVYNTSYSDQWKYLDRVYIPRINAASAFTCLKTGTVATASDANGSDVPQDGFSMSATTSVDLNTSLASLYGTTSVDACVIGTFISAVSSESGFYNVIDGDPNTSDIGVSGGVAAGTAVLNWLGGFFPAASTVPNSALVGQLIQLQSDATATAGTALLSIPDGTTYSSNNYTGQTDLPSTLTQHLPNAGAGESVQTWAMTYVASSDLDYLSFAADTTDMLEALTETIHPWTEVFSGGDSLQRYNSDPYPAADDVVFYGMEQYFPAFVTTLNRHAVTGSTLAELNVNMAADMAGENNDSAIIGAGANDIVILLNNGSTVAEIITEMAARVDTCFANLATNNIKYIYWRNIMPTKGSPYARGTAADGSFDNYDDVMEILNAFRDKIVAECATRPNAYTDVGLYAALESSDPDYADFIEGAFNTGNAGEWDGYGNNHAGYTTGTKPRFSSTSGAVMDGLHTNEAAAKLCAAVVGGTIRSVRYYKGLRP